MKSFWSLLTFALAVSLTFAGLTRLFFHGQIRGAETLWDYVHYAVGSLTTSDVGGMIPTTDGAQVWTALYVLVVWVYIFYVTVNHITNVRIL